MEKRHDNLISVIVPAYNIAEYLPRCLDSILNQTYTNLEIIVISDGSTDGTNEIIKEYSEKDNRIVPVFKENSGVSDTRNVGLDMATGEYIGFVDGDDFIEPEMYKTLLDNLLENSADISHCGYQMVFPSRTDYYYNTGKKVLQDTQKGIRDLIVGDYVEPSPCIKLYSRSVLNNVRMPKDIKINEDVLFNFYAFCNSDKSVYEDKPFYHYILRKGSASKSKVNDCLLFDPIKVNFEIYHYCLVNHKELRSIAFNRCFYSIVRAYRTINNNKLRDKLDIINTYSKELSKIVIDFPLSKRVKFERLLFLHAKKIYFLMYKIYDNLLANNKYEVK